MLTGIRTVAPPTRGGNAEYYLFTCFSPPVCIKNSVKTVALDENNKRNSKGIHKRRVAFQIMRCTLLASLPTQHAHFKAWTSTKMDQVRSGRNKRNSHVRDFWRLYRRQHFSFTL